MSFLRPVLPAPLIKSRPRPLRDPNSMLSSIKNLSRPPLFRPQVSRAAVEDRPLATAPRLRDVRAQRHYSDTLDWPMRGRLIKKEAGWASLRWLVFVAAMVSALGCKPANTPRAVVDRFIEAHYIAINLKSSERWCTGLALDKLHKEEALTLGQAIDDETRKPVIHYKLKDQRDGKDRVTYLFLATIDVPDGGSFEKKWMITARKEGRRPGRYRITVSTTEPRHGEPARVAAITLAAGLGTRMRSARAKVLHELAGQADDYLLAAAVGGIGRRPGDRGGRASGGAGRSSRPRCAWMAPPA